MKNKNEYGKKNKMLLGDVQEAENTPVRKKNYFLAKAFLFLAFSSGLMHLGDKIDFNRNIINRSVRMISSKKGEALENRDVGKSIDYLVSSKLSDGQKEVLVDKCIDSHFSEPVLEKIAESIVKNNYEREAYAFFDEETKNDIAKEYFESKFAGFFDFFRHRMKKIFEDAKELLNKSVDKDLEYKNNYKNGNNE